MNLRSLGLIGVLVAAFGGSAYAFAVEPVLLTIDLTDPCNAVITATGAFSSTDDSSTVEGAGVDLNNFLVFSPEGSSTSSSYGSLTPSGAETSYDTVGLDNASGSWVDLNLYVSGGSVETQSFSSTSSAFTGTWTVDLSQYVGELPSVGTTGNIMAGFSRTEGSTIGLWEIVSVPEPSQYGLYAFLGFAALIGWRRLSTSRLALRA